MRALTSRITRRAETVAGDDAQVDRALPPEGVMSFGEHLEELRRRCLLALAGLLVATLIALVFTRRILGFILQPAVVVLAAHGQRAEMQALGPTDSFMVYLKMALLCGLILGMPWVLHQLWSFVALGLYAREQRFVRMLTPVSIVLFAAGVMFMFFVVLPTALNFFVAFGEKITIPEVAPTGLQKWLLPARPTASPGPDVVLEATIPVLNGDPVDPPVGAEWVNLVRRVRCVQTPEGIMLTPLQPAGRIAAVSSQFGLSYYVGFVLTMALAFGLAFELPLVIVFLTSMGIVSVADLAGHRRYVILGIFVIAAVLTPSPDVLSQVLLGVPMVLLFEGALVAARVLARRKAAAESAA